MLRIKEILKEQGKTQIDLANSLGVTPIGLNKIINGNPTMDTLNKIAKSLDVDVRDLFNSTATNKDPKEELQGVITQLENLKTKL